MSEPGSDDAPAICKEQELCDHRYDVGTAEYTTQIDEPEGVGHDRTCWDGSKRCSSASPFHDLPMEQRSCLRDPHDAWLNRVLTPDMEATGAVSAVWGSCETSPSAEFKCADTSNPSAASSMCPDLELPAAARQNAVNVGCDGKPDGSSCSLTHTAPGVDSVAVSATCCGGTCCPAGETCNVAGVCEAPADNSVCATNGGFPASGICTDQSVEDRISPGFTETDCDRTCQSALDKSGGSAHLTCVIGATDDANKCRCGQVAGHHPSECMFHPGGLNYKCSVCQTIVTVSDETHRPPPPTPPPLLPSPPPATPEWSIAPDWAEMKPTNGYDNIVGVWAQSTTSPAGAPYGADTVRYTTPLLKINKVLGYRSTKHPIDRAWFMAGNHYAWNVCNSMCKSLGHGGADPVFDIPRRGEPGYVKGYPKAAQDATGAQWSVQKGHMFAPVDGEMWGAKTPNNAQYAEEEPINDCVCNTVETGKWVALDDEYQHGSSANGHFGIWHVWAKSVTQPAGGTFASNTVKIELPVVIGDLFLSTAAWSTRRPWALAGSCGNGIPYHHQACGAVCKSLGYGPLNGYDNPCDVHYPATISNIRIPRHAYPMYWTTQMSEVDHTGQVDTRGRKFNTGGQMWMNSNGDPLTTNNGMGNCVCQTEESVSAVLRH